MWLPDLSQSGSVKSESLPDQHARRSSATPTIEESTEDAIYIGKNKSMRFQTWRPVTAPAASIQWEPAENKSLYAEDAVQNSLRPDGPVDPLSQMLHSSIVDPSIRFQEGILSWNISHNSLCFEILRNMVWNSDWLSFSRTTE